MSFLKKFGAAFLKGATIATGIGQVVVASEPKAAGTVGKINEELTQIAGIIAQVEVVGQALSLPGTQKLTAATPLVAQAILQSAFMAGKNIADPAKFNAGAQKVADGMADILNSIKPEAAGEESKT